MAAEYMSSLDYLACGVGILLHGVACSKERGFHSVCIENFEQASCVFLGRTVVEGDIDKVISAFCRFRGLFRADVQCSDDVGIYEVSVGAGKTRVLNSENISGGRGIAFIFDIIQHPCVLKYSADGIKRKVLAEAYIGIAELFRVRRYSILVKDSELICISELGHVIHVGALIIWGWQKLGVTCLDKHRRGLCCFSGFSGEGELFVGRRWGEELRYLAPL